MQAPVSVVVPCYRCTETIERALASIVQQTLLPAQVLLVEDCSGDEGKTLELLYLLQQKYREEIDLKIITLDKNGGPATARNAGWEAATQTYIAFLDADDEWRPEKLSTQYEYMRENPDIVVSGHRHINLPGNPSSLHAALMTSHKKISPLSLLFRNCFPASSVMLKNEIPFRFADGKRYAEDAYLWQQIAFARLPMVRIEAPLVNYYKALYGESGLSAQLWKMEKGELSNFVALYRAGSINWLLFIAATIFSVLKYVKRLVATWMNRAAY
ncbi:MAG: glycosyltransferase family 2 protein [Gallionellaceae bacterium]|jgi:glycosyltransferase involved in cell wall biosynthesis|nr:glycosyltransferase family 2 protein [Gallionellaceae bacterium]